MDHDKLDEFLGRFVADMGATGQRRRCGHRQPARPLPRARRGPGDSRAVRRAHRLPPALPDRVAARARPPAGTSPTTRPPASSRSPTSRRSASPTRTGPNLSAASLIVLGYLRAEPRITEAFRTGAGVGWHEHDEDVFVGCDAFYRPGYVAELVPNWIPALDGVEEKLTRRGAGRRRRLRPRVVVGADRPGVPAEHRRRLGLPRRVDRARAQEGRRGGRRGPGHVRGGHARRPSRAPGTTW